MDPKALPYKPNPKAPRQVLPVLPPEVRAKSAEEVALGFAEQEVAIEAQRCLQCPKPACINACPLHIDVKRFIRRLAEGDAQGAVDVISEQSPFPGVCGRVCQHELFCEDACLIGKKFGPVAIGSLERFAADHARLAVAVQYVILFRIRSNAVRIERVLQGNRDLLRILEGNEN